MSKIARYDAYDQAIQHQIALGDNGEVEYSKNSNFNLELSKRALLDRVTFDKQEKRRKTRDKIKLVFVVSVLLFPFLSAHVVVSFFGQTYGIAIYCICAALSLTLFFKISPFLWNEKWFEK